jgi:hypothetical protein
MLQLTVIDSSTHARRVEVPPTCPKCQADLLAEDGLVLWYNDDDNEDDGAFVSYGTIADRVADLWACAECNHPLVAGTERVIPPEAPTFTVDDAPASIATLGQLIDVTPDLSLATFACLRKLRVGDTIDLRAGDGLTLVRRVS